MSANPVNTPTTVQSAEVGLGWRHPHYAELLERKPAVDFLEVHSENFFGSGGAALATLTRARQHYPVSLHGVGLSLGSAVGLDPWHLDQLARLVQQIDPVRVSDHACFARGTLGAQTVHGADLLPIPFSDEALRLLCRHVQQVQERLQRRLMVENLSAYLRWNTPDANDWPEVDFLSELARRTGCLLLVDVNNIYVNARNAELAGAAVDPLTACKQWIDVIAPESVGELHVAGHCHVADEHGEIVIDDHGSRVSPAVWELHRYALQRFGPVPTLIEWDTDVPSLDVLLEEARTARAACSTLAEVAVAA